MRECVRLVHLEANEERKDTETKTETRRKGTKTHFGPVLFLRFFFSFYWFIFFTGFFFLAFLLKFSAVSMLLLLFFFSFFPIWKQGQGGTSGDTITRQGTDKKIEPTEIGCCCCSPPPALFSFELVGYFFFRFTKKKLWIFEWSLLFPFVRRRRCGEGAGKRGGERERET